MSVVKKYQNGGKAQESLQDFLAKKINSTKFTAKGESLVRESASNFLKLYNLHLKKLSNFATSK